MCGIATIAIGRSSRGRIPYPLFRNFVRELLIELSVRGQDASGIAVVNDSECFVFKKPLRPQRFVVRPTFDEILSKIGTDTNFIMLHSRAASVGGNSDNFNNHPIITDPIIGIHNGTLYNDDRLFKKYKKKFKPEGSVDSEVIFKLLNMYLQEGLAPKQAMQLVSQQLVGAFTGAAVDMQHTNRIIMFKFGRPLAILRLPHYDTLIAISEARFYDGARNRLKMKAKDTCVYPKEKTGFLVDVNAGRVTGELTDFHLPVKKQPTHLVNNFTNWYGFED